MEGKPGASRNSDRARLQCPYREGMSSASDPHEVFKFSGGADNMEFGRDSPTLSEAG